MDRWIWKFDGMLLRYDGRILRKLAAAWEKRHCMVTAHSNLSPD
jgi:hypothetical protein